MNWKRTWLALGVGLAAIVAAGWAQQPKGPPAGVELREDVVYRTVDGEELKLDLATPKGVKGARPIVLCVHGGGWQAGRKEDMRDAAYGLAAQGFAAAAVQYRLAPKHQNPAQFEDVRAAVEFLWGKASEWNLDGEKIGAFGGSAGGHLVLMLATEKGLNMKGVVSLAGPTDLGVDLPDWTRKIVIELMGGTKEEMKDAYEAASPLHRVSAETCPIVMIHGDEDEIVPYEQSTAMKEACEKAGVPVELLTIHGGKHGGGGTKEENEKAVTRAVMFLRERLMGEKGG